MGQRKKKVPPFVMLERSVLKGNEWQSLRASSRDIYMLLKANYNGGNNGGIKFKYEEAKNMHSPATISRALKQLITEGWLEKTQHGGLHRYYCLYKLTWSHDINRQ